MPGIAKRKYDAETVRFSQSLTRPLSLIVETMRPGYSREDLLKNFQYFYPYEWKLIGERYQVYKGKDKFLIKMEKRRDIIRKGLTNIFIHYLKSNIY